MYLKMAMGNRLTRPLIAKIQNHYEYSLRPTLNCGNRGFFLCRDRKTDKHYVLMASRGVIFLLFT